MRPHVLYYKVAKSMGSGVSLGQVTTSSFVYLCNKVIRVTNKSNSITPWLSPGMGFLKHSALHLVSVQ